MAQNPFIVQRPIKYGEPFCNRTPEIQRLEKSANRSEAICIPSIRCFGKTSPVNQGLGRLEEAGWLSVCLDRSCYFSLRSMIREFERALFFPLRKLEKAPREVKDRIQDKAPVGH